METFLNLYLVISTVLFAYLFNKNWTNLFHKFTMFILSVCGFVLSLNAFGFIVKV